MVTSFGFIPQVQEALDVNPSESDATLTGRVVGDVVSIVLGTVISDIGLGVSAGGIVASCLGSACVAAIATVSVGAAVMVAGAGVAVNGGINLGENLAQMNGQGGSTSPKFSIDDLINAANKPDRNGLTKAGRALQKHGSRQNSSFPKIKGKPDNFNKTGIDIVQQILNDPNSTFSYSYNERFGNFLDVISPDGSGIRYNADTGDMIGFLEP